MNDAIGDFLRIEAAVTSDTTERLNESSLHNSCSLSDFVVSGPDKLFEFLSYLRESCASAGEDSFLSRRPRGVERIFNHLPSSFLFRRRCATNPDDRNRPGHPTKTFLQFVPFNGLFHHFQLFLNLIAAAPYFCWITTPTCDRSSLQ